MVLLHALLLAMTPAPTYKCKDASGNWTEAACIGTAAPPEPSDYAKFGNDRSRWINRGPASRTLAQTCLEDWRPLLKDPASGQLVDGIDGRLMEGKAGKHIIVEGRARNGFGALGVQWFVCEIGVDGAVVADSSRRLAAKAEQLEKWGIWFAYPGSQ